MLLPYQNGMHGRTSALERAFHYIPLSRSSLRGSYTLLYMDLELPRGFDLRAGSKRGGSPEVDFVIKNFFNRRHVEWGQLPATGELKSSEAITQS